MDPDRANSGLLGVTCGGARGRPVEFAVGDVARARGNADALPNRRLAAIDEPAELQSPANRLVGVA
ncbi:hypothetical protein [Halolamina sp. C58]|uniref:hypothetical protein n=1 Tax=Halolamina sp. C58 TaxID=3421640 RepID=UPI003EB72F6D